MASHPDPDVASYRLAEPALGTRQDLEERFPWLLLLRAPRVALDLRLVVLSAVGLALMLGGWWLLGQLFTGSNEKAVKDLVEVLGRGVAHPIPADPQSASIDATLPGNAEIAATGYLPAGRWDLFNPLFGSWELISQPFWKAFAPSQSVVGFTYALLCGIWAVAVWSFFGAVVSRVASVRLAREERAPIGHAVRHAVGKYGSYFWAPLLPLVGIMILALPIVAAGWLFRINAGVLLAAVFWPLALVLGLLMAVFAVGLALGWPLMWATISVERTDSFDALSRTYSYVYQRPVHYLLYAAGASLIGWLVALFAIAFATLVIFFTLWAASWTSGNLRMGAIVAQLPAAVTEGYYWIDPSNLATERGADEPAAVLGGIGLAGARVLAFWLLGVKFLALGVCVSYFWTASTAMYLLLRSQVDNTEIDDIRLEDEEAQFGLPPLGRDAAGVPKVADEEADDESQPVTASSSAATADVPSAGSAGESA